MSTLPHSRGPLPWLAFALCCSIWGSTFLFIRMSNDSMPPLWGAALRLGIATLLFALLAVVLRRRWPDRASVRATLIYGAVNFGVSLPLLYVGEKRVPSGLASVLYATIPLTTAVFARLMGMEPLRPRIVGASLVAIGGVALLFSSRLSGDMDALHLVLVGMAATTAGMSGVLLKRAPRTDPFTTNVWAHGVGSLLCMAASLALHETPALPQGDGWWPLAYLSVVGSIGAFTTFTWLIRRWPVTRMSFSAVIIPLVALMLGMIVLRERPGTTAFIGAAIVLGAVLVGLLGPAGAVVPGTPRTTGDSSDH